MTNEVSPFAHALAQSVGARQAFRVCIVAAVHIQPSEAWVQALMVASRTATIIIVDDSNGKVVLPEQWDVFGYERQREALGDDLYKQFEMFHKSSACKTFGVWMAHKRGFDPIIVIDSDCIIPPDFVAKHIEALISPGDGWDNPLAGTGFYSRGFPYYERSKPVWAHMGLWENELDLYGTDRVGAAFIPKMPPQVDRRSNGALFPLSGMNVSFRNDAAPYMLFLPNFEFQGRRFTRHDDIWGGYIFQRMAAMLGFAVSYGNPVVFHDTVVVPEEDAREEEMMIRHERRFYDEVDFAFAAERPMLKGIDFAAMPTATEMYEALAREFNAVVQADAVQPPPEDEMFPFAGLIPALQFGADMFREKK